MEKIIIGYGRTKRAETLGGYIHIIVTHPKNKETVMALCDKRTIGLIPFKDGKIITVNCPACKKTKTYRDLMDAYTEELRKQGPKAKRQEKKEAKKKAQPKKETKKEEGKTQPKEKHWKVEQGKTPTEKTILHIPTQQAFFEVIPTKVARLAVFKLNKLDGDGEKWGSKDSPVPKGFVVKVREIVSDSFKELGIKSILGSSRKIKRRPKEDREKKKGRIITRRDKSKDTTNMPGRKIKRRSKKSKNLASSRRKGSPGHTVAVLLMAENGVTLIEGVKALKEKHKLTEKKATSKFKGVIRKTCRKQGITILVEMKGNPGNDRYKIG